jgi:hypothetical protein
MGFKFHDDFERDEELVLLETRATELFGEIAVGEVSVRATSSVPLVPIEDDAGNVVGHGRIRVEGGV